MPLFPAKAAILLGVCLTVVSGQAAFSQNLSNSTGPAEQPPSSYSANQYVDSDGCVFIRAGYGGNVSWVPRVNRSRDILCGYAPSLSGGALAAIQEQPPVAVETSPAAAPARVVIAPASGTQALPTSAPTQTVRAASPAPQVQTATPVAPVQTRRVASPASDPVPAAPSQPAGATCPGVSELAAQYLRGQGVRCGPQSVHPGTQAYEQSGALLAPVVPTIPAGYAAVWEDGRLNPMRGVGTAAGDAQMSLIWTNTVPRRLVDPDTGTDVTNQYTVLISPSGYTTARPVRARSAINPQSVTASTSRPTVQQAVQISEPSATGIAVNTSHRYVQVASYTDRTSADQTRAQMAGRGISARIGELQRGNTVTNIILIGPFETPQRLAGGLVAARQAGFADAFTRR
jgi:hypothetical protein